MKNQRFEECQLVIFNGMIFQVKFHSRFGTRHGYRIGVPFLDYDDCANMSVLEYEISPLF